MCTVGGFAFVFVAQDLKDGKEYALKVCIHFILCYIVIHLTLMVLNGVLSI